MRRAVWAALGLAILATSGCALPRGAALQREILSAADDPAANVVVYPVTRATLPAIAAWPDPDGPAPDWIAQDAGAAGDIRIAPFDTLSLVVWDSAQNSLFTSEAEKVVEIDALRVNEAGEIFVPYIGYLRVEGATPDAARRQVERALTEIVPSAQVQLAVAPGTRGSVTLVGGVAQPGSYPLPEARFTVLDLIGQGGGPADLRNPRVRLVRDGRSYATALESLLERPGRDTVLRGGDKVALVADDRSFRALGAAGQQQLVPFETESLSAADALGLMAGLNPRRADPRGLLVLREYPPAAVRAGAGGPDKARVVFTFDLTSADGLFSAGRFPIRPDDTVLATESVVTSAEAAAALFGTLVGISNRLGN